MSGGSFPTLGLKFDLKEIVGGEEALKRILLIYEDLGKEADQAKEKARAAATSQKQAGDQAASTGEKKKRSADTAAASMKAENRAIDETIAKLNLLNKVAKSLQLEQRAKGRFAGIDTAQLDAVSKKIREVSDFQGRMARQRATQEQAAAAQVVQAQRQIADAYDIVSRRVRDTAAFQERMARQRGAEEQAAAQQVLQSQRIIADAFEFARKKAQDVTNSQLSLAKQREEAYRHEAEAYQASQAQRIQGAVRRIEGPAPMSSRDRAIRQTQLNQVFGARPEIAGDMRSMISALFGFGKASDDAAGKGRNFIGMLQNMGRGVRSVRLTLLDARFAIAAMMAAFTLGPLAGFADQMSALEARTRLYASSASDVPFLLEKTYQVAQRARAPLEGVAALYTRLAPLGQQLGRSQNDLLNIVETVSKAFTIGGASAAEATSSAQQFAQALSSNRFGGDELRSVAENAPILLAAIAQGVNQLNPTLNLNAATFIKWAQAGNANSLIMVQALEKARAKIDNAFRTLPMTIGQGMTVVKNAITQTVGEIDRLASTDGTKLSTQIGKILAQFARFVESRDFIEGAAQALRNLVTVVTAAGKVIAFVANNWQALALAIGSLVVARTIIGIITVLTSSIGGASGAAYLMANGINAVKIAMAGLLSPMGLVTVAVGVLTAGWLYYADAQRTIAHSTETLSNTQSDLLSVIDRASLYATTYGVANDNLAKVMSQLAGQTDGVTTATGGKMTADQEAAKIALDRANAERILTGELIRQRAAEAGKQADKLEGALDRSKGFDQFFSGVGLIGADPSMAAAQQRAATNRIQASQQADRDRVARLRQAAAQFDEVAKTYDKPLTIDQITGARPGTGIATLPPNKDKSGKAGERRLERLDSEIEKSHAAVAAIKAEIAARAALSNAMTAFYATGSTNLDGYVAAMNASMDATRDARIEEDRRRILASQDAKSLGDLTGVELERTKMLIAASAAEIKAADSAERLSKARDTLDQVNAEIGGIRAYTKALQEGEDALRRFEITQAALKLIQDSGGTMSATTAVAKATEKSEAAATSALAERTKQRAIDLRLSEMSTREAQIETEAMALAVTLQKELTGLSYDEALNRARSVIEIEKQQDKIANLKRELKDGFEQAFVDSGKLDFKALRQGVTRALRQSIYDALIAKPIDIVINAVVDVATKGLESMLDRLLNGSGGSGGGIIDGIASLLGGGKTGFDAASGGYGAGSLKGMDDLVDSVTGASKTMAGTAGKLSSFLGAAGSALGFAFLGSSVTSALGIGTKSKGGQIGGLVGGAAGGLAGLGIAGALSGLTMAAGAGGATIMGMQAGMVLGPVGAIVGALAGALLGGLIGPKPSNQGAGVQIIGNSSIGAITGQSRSPETEEAGKAAAQAIINGVKAMQDAGIQTTREITGLVIGTRDQSQIYTSDGQTIYAAKGDVGAAADAGLKALLVGAHYVSDAQKALVDSMLAAGSAFDDIILKLQKFNEAQDFFKSIDRAILGYKDPKEAALANLRDQQIARRQTAIAYGKEGLLSPDQMTALSAKFAELERLEIVDTLSQFNDAIEGAIASADDFAKAQKDIKDYLIGLKTGALSPLNPEAQLTAAGQEFMRILQLANGGNKDALGKVTDASSEYLGKAQSFYGSSPQYNLIFETVTSALNALANKAYPGTTEAGAVTADGAAVQAAVDALQTAIEANFASLITAVDPAANDNVTGQDIADQTATLVAALQGVQLTVAQAAEADVLAQQQAAGQVTNSVAQQGSQASLLAGGQVNMA